MWGLLFSLGNFWRVAGGGGAVDPLAPGAPVLTWDTAASDNTPTFTADFDDTAVWDAGSIDASNYDEIILNWDTDSGFGSVDSDTNTLDAGEIAAGSVAFTTGALADGTWYARVRHNHVVAGVDHFSPWSNTVSETIDATGPTISTVAITSSAGVDETYTTNDVVQVTITWNEAATVTGTPQLTLNVGGSNKVANYASGTGTPALVFSYTIQAGDNDANGISIAANSLALNGGTIRDALANNATLTHSAVTDQSGHKVVTTDTETGLVSYWPCNEGSGTTVTDSQSAHNGTLSNAALWGSGLIAFDGTGFVSIADHADFNLGGTFTIFAAINGAAQDSKGIFCSYDSDGTLRSWGIFTGTSGAGTTDKMRILLSDDGTSDGAHFKNYTGSQTILDSTNHSVAFRFDGGTLDLFVDGVKDASVTKTTDAAITSVLNSTGIITLGSMATGPNPVNQYTGQFKKARIYNVAKSDGDIAAIHSAYQ